jgi:hypothetical protein
MALNYEAALYVLTDEFDLAEEAFREGETENVPLEIQRATLVLFRSQTQAYREALIGCALARILDETIDIRLPYANQGPNAFNGRSLTEKVVTPFLHEHRIPASKNPYLSALRRNISFVPETLGQKDARGYAALLSFIDQLRQVEGATARQYLRYLLQMFLELRDRTDIKLSDVKRLSLDQYKALVNRLLATKSGGLMPVLLSVGMFKTLSDCYDLGWQIEWQGINVADAAKGAGGDITVSRNDDVLFSVEVTERQIDRNRVTTTFNGKIAPNGIDDYLFFHTATLPTNEARETAKQCLFGLTERLAMRSKRNSALLATTKPWLTVTRRYWKRRRVYGRSAIASNHR